MALLKFSVVKFKTDKSIEFVPSTFLASDLKKCSYPTRRLLPPDFEELRRNSDYFPPDNWPKYKIKRFYGSYATAQEAETRVQYLVDCSESEGSAVEIGQRPHHNFPGSVISQVATPHEGPHHPNEVASIDSVVQSAGDFFGLIKPSTLGLVNGNSGSTAEFLPLSGERFSFQPLYLEGNNALSLDTGTPENSDCSDTNQALLTKILENQKAFELQLGDIKNTQLQILSRLGGESTPELTDSPRIPLGTKAELKDLENWLESPSNFNQFVSGLAKLGGHAVPRCTYTILNYIFVHEFALTIRQTSTSGKLGIGSFKVVDVVRESVRKSFPNATNQDIDKCIWAWFRTSTDRRGGRAKRKRSPNTTSNNKKKSSTVGALSPQQSQNANSTESNN